MPSEVELLEVFRLAEGGGEAGIVRLVGRPPGPAGGGLVPGSPRPCWPGVRRATDSLGGALSSVQYMPATIDTRQTVLGARLDVTTDYPRTGTVSITVRDSRDQEAGLGIRIPHWAHHFELTVNGRPAPVREAPTLRRLAVETSRPCRAAPVRTRPQASPAYGLLTGTPEALPIRRSKGPLTCDFTCSGGRI